PSSAANGSRSRGGRRPCPVVPRCGGACPSPKRCPGRWQALRDEVTSLRTAMAPWSHMAGRVVLSQGRRLAEPDGAAVTVAIKRASSHPDFTQELPRKLAPAAFSWLSAAFGRARSEER